MDSTAVSNCDSGTRVPSLSQGPPEGEEPHIGGSTKLSVGMDVQAVQYEDSFVKLCIQVEAVTDLANSRSDQRRSIFVKFSVDPGNVTASTSSFISTERCERQATVLLPASLIAEAGRGAVLVEVWEVQGELQHEFVGHSRVLIHQLLGEKASTSRLFLTRRRGKTRCGELHLIATLSEEPSALALTSLQEAETTASSSTGRLTVMILECRGLPENCDPIVVAGIDQSADSQLRTDTARCDEEGGSFVWNHRFYFEMTLSDAKKSVAVLNVVDEADESSHDLQKVIGTATIKLATWSDAWIPLHPRHEANGVEPDARIRIACCFLLENLGIDMEVENSKGSDQPVESTFTPRVNTSEAPLTLPLGSLLEVRVSRICQLSSAAAEYITELTAASDGAGEKLSLRGRLLLVGGDSQRAVANASVRSETTHCKNQVCARLFGEDGEGIVLRFELGPDVFTDEQPQLRVEIRSKRSKRLEMTLCMALTGLLKYMSPVIEKQLNLQLLDQEDRACGLLDTRFRGGLESDLEDPEKLWTAAVLTPDACVVTVQVLDMQTISGAGPVKGDEVKCFARIWSSSTGKRGAETISPLFWGNREPIPADNRPKPVTFKVGDASTEVFSVGLYRFSVHERNEQLSFGSFSLNSESTTLREQRILLFPTAEAERQSECGWLLVALNLARTSVETPATEDKTSFSLAATGLGGVSYPVERCEMRCRFDIESMEIRSLPAFVSKADCIIARFRMPHNNWSTELTAAKAETSRNGGGMGVVFSENAHPVLRWSAKDRVIPILEISMYLQHQKPPKHSADWRQTVQNGDDPAKTILLGTYCLSLGSFFTQPNTWIGSEMRVTIKPNTDTVEGAATVMSMLANLRVSPIQIGAPSVSTSIEALKPVFQRVKGDVCIHLLQATGNFLKKTDSLALYYVSIAFGSEVAASRCCTKDDSGNVSWNEQLALPVQSLGSPVIQLWLWRRPTKSDSVSKHTVSSSNLPRQLEDDEVVGYLTVPVFPKAIEDSHLLRFSLPFGTALVSNATVNGPEPCVKQPNCQKQGTLTFELQFLDRQNPTTTVNSARENVELVIHQLRGELRDSNPASNGAIGLSKHVFVDVSIMTTLNDRPEYQPAGTTNVIPLSKSGVSNINEVVSLSTPSIAAKILENPSAVVIGKVLDLSGGSYGRVQLPLRKGWRARLAHRKTPTWYAIRNDASSTVADTEGKGEASALLMSLRIGSTVMAKVTPLREVVGRFHVKVAEVVPVLRDRERLSVFKRINGGGVSVEITCGSSSGIANAVNFRTRPTMAEEGENNWCWGNEWVTLDHTEDSTALETLRVSLHFGIHRNERSIDGSIDLLSCLDDAKLGSFDQWIELRSQQEEDEAAVIANLHLVVSYIPKISGIIRMEFAKARVFTESELHCHIERTFFTCVFNKKNYTTLLDTKEAGTASVFSEKSRAEVLHVPLDSSLNGASNGLPVFSIQWMGVTKAVGEICLGVFTTDLLSVVDCCSLAPKNSMGIPNSRAKWCALTDKSDPTRKTGIVSLRLGFEPANCSRSCSKDGLAALADHRVASAEVFAVWKKLFYLLDQNGNGQIDRKEFTDVFVSHLDEMVEASDGQKLVQLLFDETNQDGNNGGVPTLQQVETLFTKIDTDHDNQIQWTEYLQFLQRKHQQVYPSVDESVKAGPQDDLSRVEVASPIPQQTKELRRKKREDRSSNQSQAADPAQISEQARREEKAFKLPFSSQERSRLNQQVASLEAVLALERRRFAELAADRQALMRSYQQLHLKHQNDVIQEQMKAKWMKQTIERQQQLLQERETLRQHRDDASIVLQSTVRARLEQKRFQGLKLHRSNAAITIQCLIRRLFATKELKSLREADRALKCRIRAASRLQAFTRFHLNRKERLLLTEARKLSAFILQKHTRRMLASSKWKHQKTAILALQCWLRQRLAVQSTKRLNCCFDVVKTTIRVWVLKWRYQRIRRTSHKLQRWWRRVTKERSAFLTLLEAVICIQAAWKRKLAKTWVNHEFKRQNTLLSEVEASICIQATWRGRQQRLQSVRSLLASPRVDSDATAASVAVSSKAELQTDDFKVEGRLGSGAVDTFDSTSSQEEETISAAGIARGERDESVSSLTGSNGDTSTQYLSNGEASAADAEEELVASQLDDNPAEDCIRETVSHQEQPFSEGGDDFTDGSSDPTTSDLRELLEEMTDWVVSAAASTNVNVEDVAVSSSEGSELPWEGSIIIERQPISPRSHEVEGKDSNDSNPTPPPTDTPTNLVAGDGDLPSGELAPSADSDDQMDPKSLDVDGMAPSLQASTNFNENAAGSGDGELPTPSNDDPTQTSDGGVVDTIDFNHSKRPNSHQDPVPDDAEDAEAIIKSELSAEIGQSDHHVELEGTGLASDDPLQPFGLDKEGDGDASIPLESDEKGGHLSSPKANVDSGEDPDPTEIKGITVPSGMVPTSIRESPVQRDMVQSDEDADESDEDEDGDDSSIDSSDLMLEADAMGTLEAGVDDRNVSPSGRSKRSRRQGRMDSMKLLADFRQLDEHQQPRCLQDPEGS